MVFNLGRPIRPAAFLLPKTENEPADPVQAGSPQLFWNSSLGGPCKLPGLAKIKNIGVPAWGTYSADRVSPALAR